jgi:hypothetical protein
LEYSNTVGVSVNPDQVRQELSRFADTGVVRPCGRQQRSRSSLLILGVGRNSQRRRTPRDSLPPLARGWLSQGCARRTRSVPYRHRHIRDGASFESVVGLWDTRLGRRARIHRSNFSRRHERHPGSEICTPDPRTGPWTTHPPVADVTLVACRLALNPTVDRRKIRWRQRAGGRFRVAADVQPVISVVTT